MASRGGRGGRGRGGANKPMVPMGHLQFAEVIAMSKEGTDVLYPVSAHLSERPRATPCSLENGLCRPWNHLILPTPMPARHVLPTQVLECLGIASFSRRF